MGQSATHHQEGAEKRSGVGRGLTWSEDRVAAQNVRSAAVEAIDETENAAKSAEKPEGDDEIEVVYENVMNAAGANGEIENAAESAEKPEGDDEIEVVYENVMNAGGANGEIENAAESAEKPADDDEIKVAYENLQREIEVLYENLRGLGRQPCDVEMDSDEHQDGAVFREVVAPEAVTPEAACDRNEPAVVSCGSGTAEPGEGDKDEVTYLKTVVGAERPRPPPPPPPVQRPTKVTKKAEPAKKDYHIPWLRNETMPWIEAIRAMVPQEKVDETEAVDDDDDDNVQTARGDSPTPSDDVQTARGDSPTPSLSNGSSSPDRQVTEKEGVEKEHNPLVPVTAPSSERSTSWFGAVNTTDFSKIRRDAFHIREGMKMGRNPLAPVTASSSEWSTSCFGAVNTTDLSKMRRDAFHIREGMKMGRNPFIPIAASTSSGCSTSWFAAVNKADLLKIRKEALSVRNADIWRYPRTRSYRKVPPPSPPRIPCRKFTREEIDEWVRVAKERRKRISAKAKPDSVVNTSETGDNNKGPQTGDTGTTVFASDEDMICFYKKLVEIRKTIPEGGGGIIKTELVDSIPDGCSSAFDLGPPCVSPSEAFSFAGISQNPSEFRGESIFASSRTTEPSDQPAAPDRNYPLFSNAQGADGICKGEPGGLIKSEELDYDDEQDSTTNDTGEREPSTWNDPSDVPYREKVLESEARTNYRDPYSDSSTYDDAYDREPSTWSAPPSSDVSYRAGVTNSHTHYLDHHSHTTSYSTREEEPSTRSAPPSFDVTYRTGVIKSESLDEHPQHDSTTHGARERQPWAWNVPRSSDVSNRTGMTNSQTHNSDSHTTSYSTREEEPSTRSAPPSSDETYRTGVIKSEPLDERPQHDSTTHGARERQPWAWNVLRSSDVSNRTGVVKSNPWNGRSQHNSTTHGGREREQSTWNAPPSSDRSHGRGAITSEPSNERRQRDSTTHGARERQPWAWNAPPSSDGSHGTSVTNSQTHNPANYSHTTSYGTREKEPSTRSAPPSSDTSYGTGVIKSESLDERRQHDSTAHGARERQPWAWNVSRSSDVSNRTDTTATSHVTSNQPPVPSYSFSITKTDPANGRGEHDSSTAGDIPNWQIKPSARNPPSSSDPSYRRGIIKSETIDDSYEQNSSGYGGSSASPQAEPLNRNHPNSSAECFRRGRTSASQAGGEQAAGFSYSTVITKTDPANSRGEHDSSTAGDIPNWQRKNLPSSSDPSYRRGIIKSETIDDSYEQNSSGYGGSSVSPQAEPLNRNHPNSSDDSFKKGRTSASQAGGEQPAGFSYSVVITKTDPANSRGEHDSSTADDIPNWQKKPSESSSDPSYRRGIIKTETIDDSYQQNSSGCGGSSVSPQAEPLSRSHPSSSDDSFREGRTSTSQERVQQLAGFSYSTAVIKSEPSDDGYQQHSSAHGGHPAPSQKALKRKAPPSSDECYRKRNRPENTDNNPDFKRCW